MKLPIKPEEDETRGAFVRRAIPELIDSGTSDTGKAAAKYANRLFDAAQKESTHKPTWKNKR